MADRKPLVADGVGGIQQLQSVDDLDIPLNSRVDLLEWKLRTLLEWMVTEDFEIPPELLDP